MNYGQIKAVEAVKEARQKWENAPRHIHAMAGAYMGPVLAALEQITAVLLNITIIEGENDVHKSGN